MYSLKGGTMPYACGVEIIIAAIVAFVAWLKGRKG